MYTWDQKKIMLTQIVALVEMLAEDIKDEAVMHIFRSNVADIWTIIERMENER